VIQLKHRKLILWATDLSMVLLSGLLSLFVRFGWDFSSILGYLPVVLTTTGVLSLSLFLNGVYRIIWAYMSSGEILVLFRSFALGYAIVLLLDWLTNMVLPRSIGIMMVLGAILLILSSRFWWIWILNRKNTRRKKVGSRRIAIVGAGEAGVGLLDEIRRSPRQGDVALFVDDSPRKIGRKIRGVPVFGPIEKVNEIARNAGVEEIILAIPSAKPEQIKSILAKIQRETFHLKILPSFENFLGKNPGLDMVREISIEDLLGREPVKIDLSAVGALLHGKKVLITGAGGSIGSEITRQVAKMQPGTLFLLGRGENSIYQLDAELQRSFPAVPRKRIIADVTDEKRICWLIGQLRPDIVFHTAAHKHVPLMEENPSEAFRVNAKGTKNLIDACILHGVCRFILISTDKAVNPTSVMGASKRLAEMYLRARARETTHTTTLSLVRFGNVLGSRGSVIPRFREQIRTGGPVTITDPQMRRFFMTIPEASALVLQASTFAKNGDLFVLDMGEQVYIKDLVEKMIFLAGLVPGQDVHIVYSGIRPGEKLYEELFLEKENVQKTSHPKIFKVLDDNGSDTALVSQWIELLLQKTSNGSGNWQIELQKIIPDQKLTQ